MLRVRFGNSQLHNIGAILGGMASQEIIKVITRQWSPVENTVIFDGIVAGSAAHKL